MRSPGRATAAPDAIPDVIPDVISDGAAAARRRESLLTVMRKVCQPGGALTDGSDGTVTLVLHDVGVKTDEFEDPTQEINSAACVLNGIGVPTKVAARIGHTSASAGRQHAAWGNFTVSWTAHPHDGLNLVITEN
ncbi:MAG TPA: hypothetical protein VH969_12460 [Actinophytocola sp.]|jgi:hypothetical protein|uniref:hypothetical protein n=1 Tax=Actinophytocola sp. TaxID=1872138 RepID=UPI002F94A4E7